MPSIAQYKNIIFDFGGVILPDSFQPLIEQEFKGEKILPLYLVSLPELPIWKEWNKGLVSKQNVIDNASLQYDRAFVTRLIDRFLNPNRPLIQESVDAIHQLKAQGYRLYLLSNMTKDTHESFVLSHPEIFE